MFKKLKDVIVRQRASRHTTKVIDSLIKGGFNSDVLMNSETHSAISDALEKAYDADCFGVVVDEFYLVPHTITRTVNFEYSLFSQTDCKEVERFIIIAGRDGRATYRRTTPALSDLKGSENRFIIHISNMRK